MELREMGLLAGLPKVELAKLSGEAEEIIVSAGTGLAVHDTVYFVSSGTLELRSITDELLDSIGLATVGPGEMMGECALCCHCPDALVLTALTECVVYKISMERWQSLVSQYPSVNLEFQQMVLARLRDSQRDLARYKRYLSTFAKELWPNDPVDFEPVSAMDELAPAMEEIVPIRAEKAGGAGLSWYRRIFQSSIWPVWAVSAVCLTVGVGAWGIWGGEVAQMVAVSMVLLWTAVNWYLDTIPDYAVALAACVFSVATGLPGAKDVFVGFADPAWFLLLGAFGLGAAIQRSGLLYRIALLLLRTLPPTYRGQATALALSGTLLTPALPAVQSRVAIAGLLSRELSEAMRFAPRSDGSAGLAMSAFLGYGQMRFLFLNGSSYTLLAWGLLPIAVRQHVDWSTWLCAALPLGILVLVATHFFTVNWYFKEQNAIISRNVIERQISILGAMTKSERSSLWVLLAVVAGFVLQPIHGVDPGWVALGGFLALVVLGALDKQMIAAQIDWQYLLFYGSLAGMVALITQSGLGDLLAGHVASWLGPYLTNDILFLLGVSILTIVLRLFFQPAPAIILAGVTFFPISLKLGFNPVVVAIVAVAASTTWLIPQLLNSYTTMYSTTQGKCFDHKQVRLLSVYHAIILLASVICSVPYWRLLGLLGPR